MEGIGLIFHDSRLFRIASVCILLTLGLCFGNFPLGVNEEVVGMLVLLMRSLFARGIVRKLPQRIAPAKSTSAALRCRWPRRMMLQSGSLRPGNDCNDLTRR